MGVSRERNTSTNCEMPLTAYAGSFGSDFTFCEVWRASLANSAMGMS